MLTAPSRRPSLATLSLILIAIAPACSDEEEHAARTVAQAITNADEDASDPAVVGIEVERSGRISCTGTVVAARLVLTAAHCILGGPPIDVYFGRSRREAEAHVTASTWRRDPGFDEATLANDVAVLVLDAPAPVAPVPILRRPLDPALAGQAARVVGFGDGGRKRAGTARIASVGERTFILAPAPSQPCSGDSGGPSFVAIDGAEVLAGITSTGDPDCRSFSRQTRVELHTDLLVEPEEDAGCSVARRGPGRGFLLALVVAAAARWRARRRSHSAHRRSLGADERA